MISSDSIIDSIKEQLKEIAIAELGGLIVRLLNDIGAFITMNIVDIQMWTLQLANGEISQAEFSFLIGGLEDRMSMYAITEAGIAVVVIQRVRRAVIDAMVSSLVKVLL